MKKLGIMAMISVMAFTVLVGCGPVDERTQLKNTLVELSCSVYHPMSELFANANFEDEKAWADIEEQSKELEAKMLTILQKNGYENENELEEVLVKYENDDAFMKEVLDAAMKKCGFDLDAADF